MILIQTNVAGFKVGDNVIYKPSGASGTVEETYTHSVKIRFLGGMEIVVDACDLELDNIQQQFDYYLPNGPSKANGCDCGAHKVYGYENCHSFWCTAYKK